MLFGQEKVSFLNTPTPLERLPRISEELGLDFYIKRDDLTNLGVGGNKLRKLELKDLDLAMLAALRQTNDFVLSQGKPLDPMSKAAYDEIKAEVDARAAKAG